MDSIFRTGEGGTEGVPDTPVGGEEDLSVSSSPSALCSFNARLL